MRKSIFAAFVVALLCIGSAEAGLAGDYQVGGVTDDDMLKMRAGPGIGFKVNRKCCCDEQRIQIASFGVPHMRLIALAREAP